jgi:hypothetical protein
MAFTNLSEEIEELFGEFQETFAEDIRLQSLIGDQTGRGSGIGKTPDVVLTYIQSGNASHVNGMRNYHKPGIFGGKTPRTVERKQYQRAHAIKVESEDIRQRLLAGERPAWCTKVGPGRPPTRWIQIAESLGIVLTRASAKKVAA